jgi:hypothetical protein
MRDMETEEFLIGMEWMLALLLVEVVVVEHGLPDHIEAMKLVQDLDEANVIV